MSCTIYYTGTLKESKSPEDVFGAISNHMQNINANLKQSANLVVINFLQGNSETLVFDFDKNKINGFWKWNGNDPEEFYKIFDMFIEIKPLFKSLKIDDDEGLWNEYVIQKQPCKIKLRPLSSDEMKFLDRIKENEINPANDIEKLVMAKSNLSPFYKSLLRIIVQDFIKIMKIESVDDFNPHAIVDLTNELNFMGADSVKEESKYFDFHFHYILIKIWISYAFEYKKLGVVKELAEDIRGLITSKEAALWGITSIFLNSHSGGASNSKEAEMRKFAKKYYKTGSLGEVMVIDKLERELEFFFSMMNYLGFEYIGVE